MNCKKYLEAHTVRSNTDKDIFNKQNGANMTTNPASTAFYSDYVPPDGPAPAAPPPAYHDTVDRTTYPPTLPSNDPQVC